MTKEKNDNNSLMYECEHCGCSTLHIKRGFEGHNLRYECIDCGTINYEEDYF